MVKDPKILIGTLYSGENELEACKRTLADQTYTHWKQRIIAHLPNKEAHATLYRCFMARQHQFDLFVKLDADMVLRSCDALHRIVGLFNAARRLDHIEIAVHDWFSNRLILGLHVFSNRCRWVANDESLFVDTAPQAPTAKQVIWDAPAPLVDHCPDPSPFQAFHFGVHRALKVLQSGQRHFNWHQFEAQSTLLHHVWNNFITQRDLRLGYAVLGADLVFTHRIKPGNHDYTDSYLQGVFEIHKQTTTDKIAATLAANWKSMRHPKKIKRKQIGSRPLSAIDYYIKKLIKTAGRHSAS